MMVEKGKPEAELPGARRGTGRWSLERRLPVLILLLLASILGAFGAAAYGEVRRTAVDRAQDRLERVLSELVAAAGRSNAGRLATIDSVASEPTTRQALADSSAVAALVRRLTTARRPQDSTLAGWELWTLDGQRRVATPWPTTGRDSSALADLRAAVARGGTAQRSPIYGVGSRAFVWTAAPVRDGATVVGVLAERLRISNAGRVAQTLRQLTGTDVEVYYTSRNGGEWVSLEGRPIAPPFALPTVQKRVEAKPGLIDRDRRFAAYQQVPGTPWMIVLAEHESTVLVRPQDFLRRMLGIGVLLLALGTLMGWLVSRHVTRPLRAITSAADALAMGEYGSRVTVAGDAELARLGTAFNAMAERMGTAHDELAERNAALQRANEAKVRFLATMSHELRTPLNAIAGYTELLQLGLRGPVTGEQVEDLTRIRRSKDHLLALIDDILSFSRADAGRLSLQLTDVPVAPLLASTAEVLGAQFAVREVRLRIGPVPDVTVRADHTRVRQVLLNLLANALNFTDAGGEVSIDVRADEATVRIDVRDTGIGIPQDRLADVFEPFVQVDASLTRPVGGTGLGLAIARDLARAMDGSIAVESELGVGSRFTVTLPRGRAATAASATPAVGTLARRA